MNKVSIFSISDSLGGAEHVLFKIAKFYSEKESCCAKIYFFKPKSNTYWKDNLSSDVEIIYLNNSIISLLKQIKKQKNQMVFSSHLIINAFLGFLRFLGILQTDKLIVRESTQVFGRYSGLKLLQYKLAYWLGYRKIDLIICQTQRMSENLKENTPFLFKRAKVKVIPNPFDFPDERLINEEITIPKNTIVSAGRLIPEKGFDILIQSFSKVLEKKPGMTLMILGEGNERNKLEKLISDLNLGQKVILKGYVKNVYPYFKKAEVCVVSSIREGFPNVLLQMMSQNERVISTDCAGGISELKGVLVIDTSDVDSLSHAIQMTLCTEVNHRISFDNELKERSINSFVYKIENHLK